MIGKLKGIIDSVAADSLLLDVNGVCYHLFCSGQTLSKLPDAGKAATLLVEMHVREDHIHMYGFATEAERHWFKVLQSVSGVGTKVALGILSAMNPDALGIALAAQDKTAFGRISGIGPKLAARLVTELKDKAGDITLATATIDMPVHSGSTKSKGGNQAITDAVSALVNLGYGRSDAFRVVSELSGKGNVTTESLIRDGLKALSTISA